MEEKLLENDEHADDEYRDKMTELSKLKMCCIANTYPKNEFFDEVIPSSYQTGCCKNWCEMKPVLTVLWSIKALFFFEISFMFWFVDLTFENTTGYGMIYGLLAMMVALVWSFFMFKEMHCRSVMYYNYFRIDVIIVYGKRSPFCRKRLIISAIIIILCIACASYQRDENEQERIYQDYSNILTALNYMFGLLSGIFAAIHFHENLVPLSQVLSHEEIINKIQNGFGTLLPIKEKIIRRYAIKRCQEIKEQKKLVDIEKFKDSKLYKNMSKEQKSAIKSIFLFRFSRDDLQKFLDSDDAKMTEREFYANSNCAALGKFFNASNIMEFWLFDGQNAYGQLDSTFDFTFDASINSQDVYQPPKKKSDYI